jgi:hypothetical protein
MAEKKKVFISYKRNVEPDEPIALEIFSQLSKDYDVFIDLKMMVGTKWSKEIKDNLLEADCFISLISENSVKSEMVSTEILIAYKHAKATGLPLILPVRLNYFEDLDYDLMAYLGSSNYIAWKSYSDTQDIIKQLRLAIDGFTFSDDKALDYIKQKTKNKVNIIKMYLSSEEFDKALDECNKMLDQNPEAHSISLLAAVGLLRGKSAGKFRSTTIKQIEGHLNNACKSQDLKPTALVIWAIVKHDHYFLNGLYQGSPSLDDIKKSLQGISFENVDISLLSMIKADETTYQSIGLPSFSKE